MHQSVRERFIPMIRPFEGRCSWMYLCRAELVTTAIGLMMPTPASALRLEWHRGTKGPLATRAEVLAEYAYVKSRKDLARHGGGAYRKLTKLRISQQEIGRVTYVKLDDMWRHLRKWLPNLDEWPADSQLGLLSMAWGLGPRIDLRRVKGTNRREWPKFTAAAKAGDFATCAKECLISSSPKRSAANRQLFENAARVVAEGLCPSQLVA